MYWSRRLTWLFLSFVLVFLLFTFAQRRSTDAAAAQPRVFPVTTASVRAPGTVMVSCETSKGSVEIVVQPWRAPLGSARFLQLVRSGFFSQLPLFRCVDGFLCQFGARFHDWADRTRWPPLPDDIKPPEIEGNFKRGEISFAGSGKNSRTTHLFITLGESVKSLGVLPWEVPFGYVTQKSMEETVSKFTTQYGDMPP